MARVFRRLATHVDVDDAKPDALARTAQPPSPPYPADTRTGVRLTFSADNAAKSQINITMDMSIQQQRVCLTRRTLLDYVVYVNESPREDALCKPTVPVPLSSPCIQRPVNALCVLQPVRERISCMFLIRRTTYHTVQIPNQSANGSKLLQNRVIMGSILA